MKIINKISICIYFILLTINLFGQDSNDLNQRVTIEANNVTLSELLLTIGEQAKIKFSYNPKLIESNKRVDLSVQKETVINVLDSIFDKKFDYKLRGNYVIISKRTPSSDLPNKDSKTILSGFIIDDETNEGIELVSIYTSAGISTITDATGAFKIELSKKDNSQIEIRKADYEPYSFETKHESINNFEIKLKAIKSLSLLVHRDSLNTQSVNSSKMEVSTMYRINTSLQTNQENINDSINKPFSFSLYPGIATYGNLSGNIKFNLAMNFIGYNRGINGAEFSMLSSINKDDVKGIQLAVLSNHVGNNVKGYQAAGIFNKVGGDMSGLQMSGITNVNYSDVKGLQIACVNNHVLGKFNGVQMSGILNISKVVVGLQMAGTMNIGDTISGAQLSGIGNHAQHIKGFQMAAVYNYADSINGTQMSGLVNIGNQVKGSQIGIVNIADSMSGIPFGLFNFIKDGYKRFGIHTDEIFTINAEFRSGVDAFYTVLRGGAQTDVFDDDNAFYTYGAGFGTRINLMKGLGLEIDATANHITKRKFTEDLSLNLIGSIGLEYKVLNNFTIAAGATYNAYVFDRSLLNDEDFNTLRSDYIIDTSDELNDHVWRSWVGYRAGLRIAF